MSFKLSQNEPHELYTQSGLGGSQFITLLLSAPGHKEQDHAMPSSRGAQLPSGGQPRGLPPFTGDAEAVLDYSAPPSLFRVDSGFGTLKAVVLDALGRCITPWQIFHGMAYKPTRFFSTASFVFCFPPRKRERTHHLTQELSLKEAGTVNKCAERRCELVFCPQGSGRWLYSCPPYSSTCGLGRAT